MSIQFWSVFGEACINPTLFDTLEAAAVANSKYWDFLEVLRESPQNGGALCTLPLNRGDVIEMQRTFSFPISRNVMRGLHAEWQKLGYAGSLRQIAPVIGLSVFDQTFRQAFIDAEGGTTSDPPLLDLSEEELPVCQDFLKNRKVIQIMGEIEECGWCSDNCYPSASRAGNGKPMKINDPRRAYCVRPAHNVESMPRDIRPNGRVRVHYDPTGAYGQASRGAAAK